jgi:hypothetical protein
VVLRWFSRNLLLAWRLSDGNPARSGRRKPGHHEIRGARCGRPSGGLGIDELPALAEAAGGEVGRCAEAGPAAVAGLRRSLAEVPLHRLDRGESWQPPANW